jgi:RNA polymerase sigma-70 factor (ECF subfamily)
MGHCLAADDYLLHAAARGDECAFGLIMQRHRGWVRSLMIAYVHDEALAEDLTQEAFCRVYEHADSYESRGQFAAWLKRIAINLARDTLRRRKGATMVPLEECGEIPQTDRHFDPAAALASASLREDLRGVIEALPDEQRLAVVMHYFGDMSLKDIAWAMKCPIGTVKSRLFYALQRVRQSLTDRWEEGEPRQ